MVMEIAVYPESAPHAVQTEAALSVFGKSLGRVSYRAELSGETATLSTFAALSARTSSALFCYLETDNCGTIYRSVAAAEQGTLLGVTDELSSPNFRRSAVRVYHTAGGNVGAIVGQDLFRYEVVHALSVCDSDLILHLSQTQTAQTPLITAALAHLCGVPILSLSGEIAHLATEQGTLSTTCKNGTVFRLTGERFSYLSTHSTRGVARTER